MIPYTYFRNKAYCKQIDKAEVFLTYALFLLISIYPISIVLLNRVCVRIEMYLVSWLALPDKPV